MLGELLCGWGTVDSGWHSLGDSRSPHSPWLSQSGLWVLCSRPQLPAYPMSCLLSRRKRGRRGPAMAKKPPCQAYWALRVSWWGCAG